MVNRRVGKTSRLSKKKKFKMSSRLLGESGSSGATSGARKGNSAKKASSESAVKQKNMSVAKKKSLTLKKQATERMVLKEHLRELKQKRQRTTKGDDAKLERRELGKYIRQLEAEMKAKHTKELADLEREKKKGAKKDALKGFDTTGKDEVNDAELKDMFAHLVA